MPVRRHMLSYFFFFMVFSLGRLCSSEEELLFHSHIHSSQDGNAGNNDQFDDDSDEEEFDREILLGSKREARFFQSLPVDAAKLRLAEVLKAIDLNSDGLLQKSELKHSFEQNLRNLDLEAARTDMIKHNNDGNNLLSWSEYILSEYGYTEQQLEHLASEGEETRHFLEMIQEDRSRWTAADLNKDGDLDLVEFAAFLSPYNYEHTQIYEVDRVLGDFDDSGDGAIDREEYAEHEVGAFDGNVAARFAELDKNGDGQLDHAEIRDWAAPGIQVTAELQAKHLLEITKPKSNANELTIPEILDNYHLWVGRQLRTAAKRESAAHTEL